jgi:hypothetical protein
VPVTPAALAIHPGVDTQATQLEVGTGLIASNLIRAKNGHVQGKGGNSRMTNNVIMGIGRALFGWADTSNNDYLAIGTSEALEIFANGVVSVISPVAHTSNLSSPTFQTFNTNPIVTVTDAGFTPVVGQLFEIVNLTYIGGLLLQGVYEVLTVPTGTTFTFNAGAAATSNSTTSSVLHFATTSGQFGVVITLGAYAFTAGQSISVGVSTTVGGVTLVGPFNVAVTAGPTYTITAPNVATSNATAFENADETQIKYFLFLSPEISPAGAYGQGLYGQGPYGIGSSQGSVWIVEWWFDRWGSPSLLVAALAGGTIYEWAPPVAPGNFATPTTNAPSVVNGLLVAVPEQQIVAWGAFSSALGEQDPMLVAWCDVADRNDWTATATNQAGNFRLSSGSVIQAAAKYGLIMLVWTDVDMWAMQYIGFPLVYSFNQIAVNCGLIAPRAWAIQGSTVAWLSQNDFFIYQGAQAVVVPCAVRDFIFDNIDRNYAKAIHADSNTWFDEITWWFPTMGSMGVCNAYVKWNVTENVWDIGGLPGAASRSPTTPQVSAWVDQSPFGAPIGTDYNGLIQQFEISVDYDMGAAPPPDSYLKSGWLQMAEGQEMVFVERVRWDINWNGSKVTTPVVYGILNFADELPTDNPEIPVRVYGPYVIDPAIPYSIVRGRGRFYSLEIHTNPGGVPRSAGTAWRLGRPLPTLQVDGRR